MNVDLPFEVVRAPLSKGNLLVALPSLLDPHFCQTVVLLLETGEDGAMGLVINRPLTLQLSEALPQEVLLQGSETVLYSGGPVQTDHILILRRGGEPTEDFTPLFEGISLGGTLDALKEAATTNGITAEFRPYVGYAGWDPGQLEAEIGEGAWLVVPGDPDLVFNSSPAQLWPEMMRAAGGPLAIYATMPGDLSMN